MNCLDIQKRKTNGASTENQERTSDASDQMETSGHREHSPDDFEEIRPKTKRSRASEGTAASAQSIELSLIGNWTTILRSLTIWLVYVYDLHDVWFGDS